MYSDDLSQALVDFFYATTVSSAIVETLIESKTPAGVARILASVRDIRRMELPQSAIESSLTILQEAGLVKATGDAFLLTDVGKELAKKLVERRNPPG